ncbi:class F sortase [Hamadaea tsunoensis]|uniref:class F sortase n=1 Tax=Hamadaea tsunoensis TaxID=53368 RepID=UPI000420147F|nr:class F sortase [Hamadaea tsunoensis]
MTIYRTRARTRRFAKSVLFVTAVAGVLCIALALLLMPRRPPAPGFGDAPAGYLRDSYGRLLTRSTPVEIQIPKIGVDAPVVPTGVADNGSIEVPPLSSPGFAGWYRYGPSPGEAGSAIIVGHVDTRATGPAVFFSIGSLRRGDQVRVKRDDGSTALFTVDGAEVVPKDRFPAAEVHKGGPAALLRLITCGGRFDYQARSYLDNIIVYATLTGRN